MDQPGGKKYVTADLVQADYLQEVTLTSQLFMHAHQEFKSLAIHVAYGLAVQDDIAPLLIDTLIKGGLKFFAILIGKGLFGRQNRSATYSGYRYF